MRRFPALLVTITLSTLLGCGTGGNLVSTNNQRGSAAADVVGNVAGTPVYLDELVNQYERNNITGEKADTTRIRELSEFLDLYLLYRAKLREAGEKGLYTSEDILKELRQYELQYAIPYWIENEIQDKLIDDYIYRSKREVDATHILVAVPEGASPSDTLRAWNQLVEARDKFLAGEDFEKLSNEYSTMYEGRSMGGPLGYFSAGWAVKPFEDVAFSLDVGEVSMPFKTQFGYHIVLVKDIRERKMDRFVSHVYFNARGGTQTYGDSLYTLANDLYRQLENGADWAQIVQQYSHDQRSIEFDGQIGWINYGAYDNSFTDPVFGVEKDMIGKPRPPIQTVYGIHIIKVDSVRTYSDPSVERQEALAALKNLPTFRDQRGLVLNRIREEVKESVNLDNVKIFHGLGAGLDSTKVTDTTIPTETARLQVYTIDSNTFTIGDYQQFIRENSPAMTWSGVNELLFDSFKDKMMELKLLEITNERYPDYRSTIENYREGLAVFKLTEDEVWNYSRVDTVSLKSLFESKKGDYQFPRRYDVLRLVARSDSTLIAAQELHTSGIEPDSIKKRLPEVSFVRETISDLSNEPFDRLKGLEAGEYSAIFEFRSVRNLMVLERIREPEPMTFEDAYFRLVSEYQPLREKQWNDQLRKKYKIQSFPSNIR